MKEEVKDVVYTLLFGFLTISFLAGIMVILKNYCFTYMHF